MNKDEKNTKTMYYYYPIYYEKPTIRPHEGRAQTFGAPLSHPFIYLHIAIRN